MRVRWDRRALRDLRNISIHIAKDNPSAAEEMVSRLRSRAADLANFPFQGRKGRIAGTRELVVPPYLILYKVSDDKV